MDVWPALELLWPTQCAGCDETGAGRLCPECLAALGARDAAATLTGVQRTVAAAPYDSPVGVALQRAKYGRDRQLMRALALAFARTIAPVLQGSPVDIVVPVPSPWTRRLSRGFATGALLAGALAHHLQRPLGHALRIRPGPRNAGLSARGRRTNLAGRVRSRPAEGHVLLVDDVVTTGATAEACARELLGTASVSVQLAVLCEAGDKS